LRVFADFSVKGRGRGCAGGQRIGITAGCALGLRKWPQLEIPRVIPAHAARTRGQEQPHLEEAMMQELVGTRRHWFAALTMALGIAV